MLGPASAMENETHKLQWESPNDTHKLRWESPNLGQKTKPYNDQQKKRTCKIVNFAVLANYKLKLK